AGPHVVGDRHRHLAPGQVGRQLLVPSLPLSALAPCIRRHLHEFFLGVRQTCRRIAGFRRLAKVEQHLIGIGQVAFAAALERPPHQFSDLQLLLGQLLLLLFDDPGQFDDQGLTRAQVMGNGYFRRNGWLRSHAGKNNNLYPWRKSKREDFSTNNLRKNLPAAAGRHGVVVVPRQPPSGLVQADAAKRLRRWAVARVTPLRSSVNWVASSSNVLASPTTRNGSKLPASSRLYQIEKPS